MSAKDSRNDKLVGDTVIAANVFSILSVIFGACLSLFLSVRNAARIHRHADGRNSTEKTILPVESKRVAPGATSKERGILRRKTSLLHLNSDMVHKAIHMSHALANLDEGMEHRERHASELNIRSKISRARLDKRLKRRRSFSESIVSSSTRVVVDAMPVNMVECKPPS